MLFNSLPFLFVFLPVVLVGYLILVRATPTAALLWIVLSSLVFYAYGEPSFVIVVIASVAANYAIGRLIVATSGQLRLAVVSLGVAGNLLALGYFKYANFMVANLEQVLGHDLVWQDVVLPIGISFFTFQQIAYLVDTHRGLLIEKNPLSYSAVVCFFPHLIAGPIVHPKEVLPQFRAQSRPQLSDFSAGLTLLIIGLFKKVAVADTVALQSTPVFSAVSAGHVPGLIEAWSAALCYTLQIYFDFSAYSDMAVGLARMFAIDFPINFASPYKARSISDFWRRWHISLSRFLRDYLYVPLGGGRSGRMRRQVNLMLTMVIGGIWHGAAWTFIVWGFLHGVYLLIHKLWQDMGFARMLARTGWWAAVATLITFVSVIVAWVPFRAASLSDTAVLWHAMCGGNGLGGFGLVNWDVMAFALALLPIVFVAPNSYQIMAASRLGLPTEGYPASVVDPAHPIVWRPTPAWSAVMAAVLVIVLLKINDASEFIYFQF